MIDWFISGPLFGLLLTVVFYILALRLYRKTRIPVLNPVLVSMLGIIALLMGFGIPLKDYMAGGGCIAALLPLTIVLLALPLYRQLPLLKAHKVPVLAGVVAGIITSAVSLFVLCRLFGVDSELIRSILPKSITTPLALIVSDSVGGLASITVVAVVFTGISGVLIYHLVFLLFRITHPVARGVALGTSSHVIGTAKALELGEIDGAMSSLAIIISGVVTVAATPLFILILASL